jgi:Uma2 family endonuclease
VPQWICEVLSPSNRAYDLRIKRRFYAEIGVEHLWYIEPELRTLTVSRLHEGRWLELAVYGDGDRVRAEPFDAIEIDLGLWWAEASS